jgi:uncharacterized protein
VANTLYHEHYETMPMRHTWQEDGTKRIVSYSWKKGTKWHSMQVEVAIQATEIAIGSEAEFITEHYYGYTAINSKKTTEYEVRHPRWLQYEVIGHQVEVDFEQVYGAPFGVLQNAKPVSVMLAEGSEIEVLGKSDLS